MKKKGSFTNVLLVILFVAGLSLLLYPSVANYVNELHGSRAIASYSESVSLISREKYDQLMQEARDFNADILKRSSVYTLTDYEKEKYGETLNVSGNGVMGYIEIPSIDVELPIYHGTSESVLQVAVGHIDWTSLPVGGESTHCVLSGHRGLPSAKLFTHLDKLIEGDVFMIRVLDEVLTYEVDQILIVEPQDTEALQIVKGKDCCTLVTCTPYGINTHRLLVRGHRIANAEEAKAVHIVAEAIRIEPVLVSAVVCVPVLVMILLIVLIFGGKKNKKRNKLRSGRKNK